MQIFSSRELNRWTQDVSCVRAPEAIITLVKLNRDWIPNYFINRPRMAASLGQIFSEQRPFQPRMWKQPLSVKTPHMHHSAKWELGHSAIGTRRKTHLWLEGDFKPLFPRPTSHLSRSLHLWPNGARQWHFHEKSSSSMADMMTPRETLLCLGPVTWTMRSKCTPYFEPVHEQTCGTGFCHRLWSAF